MKRSVTEFIGLFHSEFNAENAARLMLGGMGTHNYGSAKYEQYRAILQDVDYASQEARDLVKAEWKRVGEEASSLGTAMHKSIETYYTEGKLPDPMTPEFEMFRRFDIMTKKSGFLPFRSEKTVFDLGLSLAGSVDMLYIHRDNVSSYPTKVWMVDWKRSKEIKMTGFKNEKCFVPFDELDNSNFWYYTMQLNLYKFLLEKNHGMLVERMTLVILHPNQKEYIALDVSDIQHLITSAIEDHFPEV